MMAESSPGNVVGQTYTPGSVDEVVALVRRARQTGRPLFPVSTGMNWGYRSASPAQRGHDVADLRLMNRILNADSISERNPVAVIQPGVTQRQLYDFLEARAPGLTFNVTGSAAGTSIMGNSLDRGVGYIGPRREDLFGLEVVTGAGNILRTGFRRLGEDSPLAHCHPYGLGPMLDGLFFQGNFGIVTSACFRLAVKHARRIAVTLSLRDSAQLPRFLDALAGLKRQGVLSSVTHVGNRARSRSTLAPGLAQQLSERHGYAGATLAAEVQMALDLVAPTEWSAVGGVSGSAPHVEASVAEIRRALRGLARVNVITDRRLQLMSRVASKLAFLPPMRRLAAALTAIRPLHGLALGIPTNAAVSGLLWQAGQGEMPATDFDRSRCGLVYICPALPLNGALISEVISAMVRVAAGFQHELYATINIETGTSAVAVTNILYDKLSAEETVRAQRCADALYCCLRDFKLEVYRAGEAMMAGLGERDPAHWRQVRDLKASLDPDNIIAPGHYSLP